MQVVGEIIKKVGSNKILAIVSNNAQKRTKRTQDTSRKVS
jgi:hypothetical protein